MGALRDFFKALKPHKCDGPFSGLGMATCSTCGKSWIVSTEPKTPLTNCVKPTMEVEWKKPGK